MDEEGYGRWRRFLLLIIITKIKIAILYYFLFHLPLPNDIMIYLHLPNGRATSPFYPPLPPTVSGWLLCESSSNGGCLMQYHHYIIAPLIAFYFIYLFPSPKRYIFTSPMAAPPLPSLLHFRRLLLVGCCVSPCRMATV